MLASEIHPPPAIAESEGGIGKLNDVGERTEALSGIEDLDFARKWHRGQFGETEMVPR